jgi:hypothetical protein
VVPAPAPAAHRILLVVTILETPLETPGLGGRLSRLGRGGKALLLGAVLVLVAGLVLLGWMWRHPAAFEDYGGWGVGNTDWQGGQTAYVPITFPGEHASGSVRIRGGTPHGLTDTTGATYTYFLCTPDGGPSGAEIGIHTESRIQRECRDLVPAAGASMSLTTQQLVVAVTPHDDGVVDFHGLDLHYSDGWQNGTQRVGGDVRIRVRP